MYFEKESVMLKNQISSYCRARVRAGLCDDDDCEFCCIQQAYDMADAGTNNSEVLGSSEAEGIGGEILG